MAARPANSRDGAFPLVADHCETPQALAKRLTKSSKRNGHVSGLPCLLANAGTGGATGLAGSIADMYNKIDVLIGGGPLILDPDCGYSSYSLFKFKHTVPIYIFYATLCDSVDISIQSRVPLPGLEQAFDEAVAHLKGVSLGGLVNSLKPCATLGVDSTPSSSAVM